MTEQGTEGVGSNVNHEQGSEGNSGENSVPRTAADIAEELNEPIEIQLDSDVFDSLIEIYIRDNFIPESLEVFNDYVEKGTCVNDAAAAAIVNEMVNIALKLELERCKNDETGT